MGRGVHRPQPAHARRVDDHQPALKDAAGQPHLGDSQALVVGRVAGLGHVGGQLVDVDLLRGGHVAVGGRGRDRGASGLAVLHDRRDRRGDVVVDRRHGDAEEAVDQGALALLVLADDEHAHVGVGQPLLGPLESLDQIVAVIGLGEPGDLVEDARERLDTARPCLTRRCCHRLQARPVDRPRDRGACLEDVVLAAG